MGKIHELLKEKNMSVYRLSKSSGVPYATVNDICNEKADLTKCSAETVWRIARVLEMPMEELLEEYVREEKNSLEGYGKREKDALER